MKILKISQTHIFLRMITLLTKCRKSSVRMTLLLPLRKSQDFYLQIILLILQDYDTEQTVQPWIWKSVSQGAYIHGNASSAVMLHTSNGGWSFLRILLVLQEAEDKFGLNMMSQDRHALDSSCYILFTR